MTASAYLWYVVDIQSKETLPTEPATKSLRRTKNGAILVGNAFIPKDCSVGKTLEIRDPIHGFIVPKGEEVEIISSPVFQRLRRIRQLAFANLVYPGALHTRFDHSLGVFHLAERMAETGGLDSDQKRLIRLAALLHDLGHGPFSHVSEQALEITAVRLQVEQIQLVANIS